MKRRASLIVLTVSTYALLVYSDGRSPLSVHRPQGADRELFPPRRSLIDWMLGGRWAEHPSSRVRWWAVDFKARCRRQLTPAVPARAYPQEEAMAALLIGYARVSTDQQDLTAQRDALAALGLTPDRTYVDHGLTGTNRERPGCARRSPPVALETRWS